MDLEGLAEAPTMGQVQGDLPVRCDGRSGLRDDPQRSSRRWMCPVGAELEGEGAVSHPGRRLEQCMAADRDPGPIAPEGVWGDPRGACSGVRLHQCPQQIAEEGERIQPEPSPRRGCGGGQHQKVAGPKSSLHVGGAVCLDPCLPGLNSFDSKFMTFYDWLCGTNGVMSSDAGGSNSLFPCDLPYPEALRPPSGAVLDDEEKRLWAMNYLNVFVAWGNYVELGCPDCHGGSWEPPTVVQSRDVARRFADRLLGEVEEFASFELVNDSLFFEGSRHAAEQALRHVSCTAAGYVGGTADDSLSNALPVKAERVAMPEHAGMVDPLLLLPEDRREVVANLVALRRPEHLWEPMVRAFHNVPADEEAGLVKKLLEHKMVELVPESQLPHDSCGKMHPGGFFCVPKNETEDRLIYDRRPENSTME